MIGIAVDDLLGISGRLCPMSSAGIDFGIEIETGQQHPHDALVDVAIACIGGGVGVGVRNVRLNSLQLVNEKVE